MTRPTLFAIAAIGLLLAGCGAEPPVGDEAALMFPPPSPASNATLSYASTQDTLRGPGVWRAFDPAPGSTCAPSWHVSFIAEDGSVLMRFLAPRSGTIDLPADPPTGGQWFNWPDGGEGMLGGGPIGVEVDGDTLTARFDTEVRCADLTPGDDFVQLECQPWPFHETLQLHVPDAGAAPPATAARQYLGLCDG